MRDIAERWGGLLGGALAAAAGSMVLLGAPDAARADQAGPVLFDPSKVVTVDLTLSQAAIAALEADPDTYQPATFSLQDGAALYGPLQIGVRLKGVGSFRPITGKAAFKLKFAHSVAKQKLLGQKGMTLNNLVQDLSWVHETLAYEAFRAAGIPAARSGFAYVRVNGTGYGLYTDIEPYDDVSLARMFATTQHLYEGENGADVRPDGAAGFEVDEGEETDVSDLQALISAANATSGDWPASVAGRADLDEMIRMWAVEQYVGHWDGYSAWQGSWLPNNYYLHSDAAGRFAMLPSGTDQTFVWPVPFADNGGGVLFKRCITLPSCRARFRQQLAEVSTVIDGLQLQSRIDALAALLAPWQSMPSREPQSAQEWQTALQDTRKFLSGRPEQVADWITQDTPPPLPPPPPAATPSAVPRATAPAPARRCRVPRVRGLKLSTATRKLRAAHCKVGTVRRVGRSRLRVTSTFPRHKTVLRDGAAVRVTLKTAPRRAR